MPQQLNCRVVNGINNVCGDLMQASGVDKDFWVGYISDLSVKFQQQCRLRSPAFSSIRTTD
jgi:hypothetical protein